MEIYRLAWVLCFGIPMTLCSGCYHPSFADPYSTITAESSSSVAETSPFETTSSEISTSEMPPLSSCGDGNLDSGELCDAGSKNGSYGFCKADCSGIGPYCRDGKVHELEQCDDGNDFPYDACDNSCHFRCGNGNVEGVAGEECDQGAFNNDTNECTSECKINICGDGLLLDGSEECDAGANNDNTSKCTSKCTLNVCGDGFVFTGEEECDDGNDIDGDACSNVCKRTIKEIAAGGEHTCVLFVNGSVRCWGKGEYGRLGYDSISNIGSGQIPMPPSDVNVDGIVTHLAAGRDHTCVLLDSGKPRCWGWGNYGQLGQGNTNNLGDDKFFMPPADINVYPDGKVIHLEAGYAHNCALLEDGNVRCWGFAQNGQLGYGNINNLGDNGNEMPPPYGNVTTGGSIKKLVVGNDHNCVLLASGVVRCWGYGETSGIGYGNKESIGDDETPSGSIPLGGTVAQLTAGNGHTCALLNSGLVQCWGSGDQGRLGYNNSDNIGDNAMEMPPENVNFGGGTISQITAGGFHTCILLESGAVRCWGWNKFGQLGYGNSQNIGDGTVLMPPPNVNLTEPAIQITAGSYHTCALLQSGNIQCWGYGIWGQLGYGNNLNIGDNEDPSAVGFVPVF